MNMEYCLEHTLYKLKQTAHAQPKCSLTSAHAQFGRMFLDSAKQYLLLPFSMHLFDMQFCVLKPNLFLEQLRYNQPSISRVKEISRTTDIST